MKPKRRDFLKLSGLAGLGIAGEGVLGGFASLPNDISNGKPVPSPDQLREQQFKINEQIKLDFERARSILKPSQKQLEHGLELHRNSLVIDAYGFMPRAAYDGALLILP